MSPLPIFSIIPIFYRFCCQKSLINYLAYNIEKEAFPFECSFCNFSGPRRDNLFLHLKCTHLDEITPKIENFDESKHVKIPDCGNKICKKLFGLNRPHLFCEKCTDKEPKKYWQKRTLCTLCGQRWFSVGICKYNPGYKSHDLLEFECSHWWKIYLKYSLTRFALQ